MAVIADKTFGITALRAWFEATPLPDLGFITRQTATDHYLSRDPKFLDRLGSASRLLASDRVRAAMSGLAAKYGTNYPPPGEFFAALGAVTGLSVRDVTDSVSDGLSRAAGIAKWGAGIYVSMLALGALVVLWPTVSPLIKKALR